MAGDERGRVRVSLTPFAPRESGDPVLHKKVSMHVESYSSNRLPEHHARPVGLRIIIHDRNALGVRARPTAPCPGFWETRSSRHSMAW